MPASKKSSNYLPLIYSVLALLNPFIRLGLRLHTHVTQQQRVRIVIINEFNQVLLVQNSIGDASWTLPGGGIEKHEQAIETAARELHEELDIKLSPSQLTYVTLIDSTSVKGLPYKAPLLYARVLQDSVDASRRQVFEIKNVEWVDVNNLPRDTSPLVSYALNCLPKGI
jgi:8-oxo-dGTP diphosphatase